MIAHAQISSRSSCIIAQDRHNRSNAGFWRPAGEAIVDYGASLAAFGEYLTYQVISVLLTAFVWRIVASFLSLIHNKTRYSAAFGASLFLSIEPGRAGRALLYPAAGDGLLCEIERELQELCLVKISAFIDMQSEEANFRGGVDRWG